MAKYRHNIMQVCDLDTFFNLYGGYRNGVRDVYFVRALGEDKSLVQKILELETAVNAAVYGNRLQYYRISELPRLVSTDDVQFYSNSYEDWMRTHHIRLRNSQGDAQFQETLSKATGRVINEFRLVKANANDTIVKNFIIKMFFWIDNVLNDVIPTWTERASVKIIGENIGKEQEYLFYYMLTLLGCDVLLLNTRADVMVPDSLKELSVAFRIGPYGNTTLPPYVYREPETIRPVKTPQREQPGKPQPQPDQRRTLNRQSSQLQPETRPARRTAIQQTGINRTGTSDIVRSGGNSSWGDGASGVKSDNPVPQYPATSASRGASADSTPKMGSGRTEKSFEDLAALASSIVMIAVHNQKGEVTATGSGIMISKTGYILTNSHVVKGGFFYSVRIEDDEDLYPTQTVIKNNEHLDLAVIRIDRRLKPVPVYNGKKKLVRGQKVVAIGSPLGLFNSVSDGIIAGFRSINDREMIQFTAPISHGSSGGAVLNMYGEVIGISTAGLDSGQNLNLAVPYESIWGFAGQFID